MSASGYLPAELNEALLRGRAIPLLVDYRLDELPDHKLTVLGLLDDQRFEGVFLPDDYAGEQLIRVPFPTRAESAVAELKLDSSDAEAVHELWSRWNGGGREDCLRFTKVLAMAVAIAKLEAILSTTETSADAVPNVSAHQKKASKAKATARKSKRRPASKKRASAS